jgi:hypothetical protein
MKDRARHSPSAFYCHGWCAREKGTARLTAEGVKVFAVLSPGAVEPRLT